MKIGFKYNSRGIYINEGVYSFGNIKIALTSETNPKSNSDRKVKK